MDEKLSLALRKRWWVEERHRLPVQAALVTAHARFWRPEVKKALEANKTQDREPSSWAKLAEALLMDESNLYRQRSGERNSSLRDLLAISSILRLPIHQFVPDAQTWIEAATLILCDGPISPEEARAYTLYCLAGTTRHNPHLDPAAVTNIRLQMPASFAGNQDVEQAILKTATRLGERLMARGNQK